MRDDKVRIRPPAGGWPESTPDLNWTFPPGAFDEINARIDAQLVEMLLALWREEDTALARFADDGGPADGELV